MTATAFKAKATAGAQAVKSPPPAAPPRRSKATPLTPMRQAAAKSMRKLAASVQESHPDMTVHEHLRDAARTLESGNEEGAQRHLRAAMFALTPQSLMRNGLHTDDSHQAARQVMHGVHRRLLLVKDITDVAARNQANLRRDSGDGAAVPPPRADPNAGYGPGANAQKPAVRQPPGDQALNAPAKADGGGSDPAAADPDAPQRKGSKQFSYGWDDVVRAIDLSAKTAALEVTPAPRGKPGGPGLYHSAGNQHSPYLQNVVKALIRGGMDPHRAYAVAWSSLRKWSLKSKHPEVRAAAAGGLGLEKVAEARAHAHAVTWDDHARVIEMAVVQSTAGGGPAAGTQSSGTPQARVPAGQAGGGRFGSGSGQPAKGKTAAAKAPAKPDAHQQHVAHVAHAAQVSTQRAALTATAADDRSKAAALIQQRNALQKALASAGGKVSSGQAGSTTSANATTKSTAPAAASTASKSTTASTAPAAASTPAKAATAAPGTAAANATAAQLTTQIAALNTQINQLLAAAKQATAQAAALK